MRRIPVRRMLANFLHEARDKLGRYHINVIIVVTELRNVGVAFVLVVDGHALYHRE